LTTLRPITAVSRVTTDNVCQEVTFDSDDTVYDHVTNVIGDYVWLQSLVAVGDTICIDVAAQFASANIFYDRYTIETTNPAVATVQNNLITVVGPGKVTFGIVFYNASEELATLATLGTIRAVDPSAWIEISTAEDLAAMQNDLAGAYILKADIDLSTYGEWNPIGGPPMGNQFTGVFINPDGFIISRLRISSSASFSDEQTIGFYAGLFGSLLEAYVDGILLENVYIDVSDFSGLLSSSAGGIAGSVSKSVVSNCVVSGYIIAQYFAGGIVGSNSWGQFERNYFWGEVETKNGPTPNREMGAGGIVGYSHTRYQDGGIIDCHAFGRVIGNAHAGGIVGSYVGERFYDNTFTGSVVGVSSANELIGSDRNDFGA
jgi:hypothetical protein